METKNEMNPKFIDHLEINRFKSIDKIEFDCNRVNVFIGRPNVGKSNILEAIGLYGAPFSQNWNHYMSEFIGYEKPSELFYDRVQASNIHVESNIGDVFFRYHAGVDQYTLLIGPDSTINDLIVLDGRVGDLYDQFDNYLKKTPVIEYGKDETKVKPFFKKVSNNKSTGDEILRYGSRVRKYHFKKTTYNSNHYEYFLLPPDGKNLFTIYQPLKEIRKRISAYFKEYDLQFINNVADENFKIQKNLGDNDVMQLSYEAASDTLRRIIFHLIAIHSNKEAILLFEEPESHSFPEYIQELGEEIIANKENQFFLTTHSPYMINTLFENDKDGELNVFAVDYVDHKTQVHHLSNEKIGEILDEGAQLFSNLSQF